MFLFGCFFFFSTRNYNIYTCLRNENVCLSQKKPPKTTEQQTKPSPGLLVTNAMVFLALEPFLLHVFPVATCFGGRLHLSSAGKRGLAMTG